MRTVDADQILTHLKPYESSDEGWYVTSGTVLRLIHKAIKNAPTIDAIPVIHAHQNEYQTPPMICCSNCDWELIHKRSSLSIVQCVARR